MNGGYLEFQNPTRWAWARPALPSTTAASSLPRARRSATTSRSTPAVRSRQRQRLGRLPGYGQRRGQRQHRPPPVPDSDHAELAEDQRHDVGGGNLNVSTSPIASNTIQPGRSWTCNNAGLPARSPSTPATGRAPGHAPTAWGRRASSSTAARWGISGGRHAGESRLLRPVLQQHHGDPRQRAR